jgi:hypothetical protein
MTVDWQVLVIAFFALSLRLVVARTALEVVETDAGPHRGDQHSLDYNRLEGHARTQPGDYQNHLGTTLDSR